MRDRQIAIVLEAIDIAIVDRQSLIYSNVPPKNQADWAIEEKLLHAIWTTQIEDFRKVSARLRRELGGRAPIKNRLREAEALLDRILHREIPRLEIVGSPTRKRPGERK